MKIFECLIFEVGDRSSKNVKILSLENLVLYGVTAKIIFEVPIYRVGANLVICPSLPLLISPLPVP